MRLGILCFGIAIVLLLNGQLGTTAASKDGMLVGADAVAPVPEGLPAAAAALSSRCTRL